MDTLLGDSPAHHRVSAAAFNLSDGARLQGVQLSVGPTVRANLTFRLESVAHRPHRLDVAFVLWADFGAQTTDMDVYGPGTTVVVVTPHV